MLLHEREVGLRGFNYNLRLALRQKENGGLILSVLLLELSVIFRIDACQVLLKQKLKVRCSFMQVCRLVIID